LGTVLCNALAIKFEKRLCSPIRVVSVSAGIQGIFKNAQIEGTNPKVDSLFVPAFRLNFMSNFRLSA